MKKCTLPAKWKVKMNSFVSEYYQRKTGSDCYTEGYWVKSHNNSGTSILDANVTTPKSFLAAESFDTFTTISPEDFENFINQNQPEMRKKKEAVNLLLVVSKTRDVKINGLERELTVTVGADEYGNLYGGYAVRNPKYDKETNLKLAKQTSLGRALCERTNMVKGESVTLTNKHVLRGVSDFLFSQIVGGKILIKGVK